MSALIAEVLIADGLFAERLFAEGLFAEGLIAEGLIAERLIARRLVENRLVDDRLEGDRVVTDRTALAGGRPTRSERSDDGTPSLRSSGAEVEFLAGARPVLDLTIEPTTCPGRRRLGAGCSMAAPRYWAWTAGDVLPSPRTPAWCTPVAESWWPSRMADVRSKFLRTDDAIARRRTGPLQPTEADAAVRPAAMSCGPPIAEIVAEARDNHAADNGPARRATAVCAEPGASSPVECATAGCGGCATVGGVTGAGVIGTCVIEDWVIGTCVVGTWVIGTCVIGTCVIEDWVIGTWVIGDRARVVCATAGCVLELVAAGVTAGGTVGGTADDRVAIAGLAAGVPPARSGAGCVAGEVLTGGLGLCAPVAGSALDRSCPAARLRSTGGSLIGT